VGQCLETWVRDQHQEADFESCPLEQDGPESRQKVVHSDYDLDQQEGVACLGHGPALGVVALASAVLAHLVENVPSTLDNVRARPSRPSSA
jgi:hypothetical protein